MLVVFVLLGDIVIIDVVVCVWIVWVYYCNSWWVYWSVVDF